MSSQPRAKHAVIACHPSADSFTMAVARQYAETATSLHHEVILRDLYRMGFDPVLKADERPTEKPTKLADDVVAELEILAGTDIFVLVYPIWFGGPPAMLKGYIDRIFGADFPYGAVRDRSAHPLFTGKRLVFLTSSGTTRAWLSEQGAWLSMRNLHDEYLSQAFSFAGTDHVHFDAVTEGLKPKFVEENLYQVDAAARRVCSRFIGAGISVD